MFVSQKMTSIRRTMSSLKREGSEQNEESASDTTPSPKLPHHHSYFAFGRLLSASAGFLEFLPFPGMLLQRGYRPLDRSKAKVYRWRKAAFHLFLCFMVGIFIGFAPFVSIEISHKSILRHQTFSFVVDSAAENALSQVDVRKTMLDTPVLHSNVSLDVQVEEEEADEDLDDEIQPSLIEDLGLVKSNQLIVITPTYSCPFQAYGLNRLAQTLKNVPPPLLWIVVEMTQQSPETAEIMRKSGVMYRHLVCQKNITNVKDMVVELRNTALLHIEKHQLNGIIHFADDDTIYSLDLFDKMREIRRLGTWPVATISDNKRFTLLEGPVCNGSRVVGWHTHRRYPLYQRFHASMSGFAFHSTILWDSKTWHRPTPDLIRQLDSVKKDLQASTFIEQLVEDETQMEGLPDGCSEIMAWQLNTDAIDVPSYPTGWNLPTNLESIIPAHSETTD